MERPIYKLTKYGYYKNINSKKSFLYEGYILDRNSTDLEFYTKRKNILRRDLQHILLKIVFKAKKIFSEDLRILDVGCGDGVILEALYDIAHKQKIKIMLYGIDPDSLALKNVRVPAKLTKGTAEAMPFSDNFFHIVISSQMIEHLTEAQAHNTNKEVYRILKKDGFYYIETPNPRSVLAQAMRKQWYMYLPDHLVLYPPYILLQLLKKIGFKNIRSNSRYEKDEQVNEIQEAFMKTFPSIRNLNLARIGMFLFKLYITVFNKGAVTTVFVRK